MTQENPIDHLLHDPLSPETRQERKYLLGLVLLSIAFTKTKLLPQKISALGLESDKIDQRAMLFLVSLITLYFLVAFCIYGISDFLAWRRAIHQALIDDLRHQYKDELAADSLAKIDRHLLKNTISELETRYSFLLHRLPVMFSPLRALFEFLIPIIGGLYALRLVYVALH